MDKPQALPGASKVNRRFAVFDIDGTLIRWQLYHAVVDKLAKKGHLGLDAHEQLHNQRMVWKRREHPESFGKYEQFLVDAYEKTLTTLKPSVLDRIIKEVAQEYKDQVYTYTRDLIGSLKKQGYVLLAISGSHHDLVGLITTQYGFLDWEGTRYQRQAGKFTGQTQVAGHDKKAALEALIAKHNLDLKGSYAIGDSQSDIAMMDMVENPIAFNPNRQLYDYAKNSGWPIVVERKNVVYKLEAKSGSYILA